MGKDERYNLEGVNSDLGGERELESGNTGDVEREDEGEPTATTATTAGTDATTVASDTGVDDASRIHS